MYLKWKEITAPDSAESTLTNLYNEGFVLTRRGKGEMDQTRSLRIDLSKFVLSSENRRVLKKTEGLELETVQLPYSDYSWEIGKLGKDFYEDKFGTGTFSANKIKELLTDPVKSNFNALLLYRYTGTDTAALHSDTTDVARHSRAGGNPVGYSIIYQSSEILHYSYPFYDRATEISNLGLGMMLRAILHAQETGKKYIYLGSAQRPTDIYKLQFTGLEWFDGEKWETDQEKLRETLLEKPKSKIDTELINKKKISKKPASQLTIFFRALKTTFLFSLVVASILILIAIIRLQLIGPEIYGKGPMGSGIFTCTIHVINFGTLGNEYHCNLIEFLSQIPRGLFVGYIVFLFMSSLYYPIWLIVLALAFYYHEKKVESEDTKGFIAFSYRLIMPKAWFKFPSLKLSYLWSISLFLILIIFFCVFFYSYTSGI